MNRSTRGLPVHHQLPESTQTHVHRVDDAIQPSHPLSSPFPPAFNLSQHQGIFKWVNSSHQVGQSIGVSVSTSVLPMNAQNWSPLEWTRWISLQSKGLSRVFSNTTVQKHQFFGAQVSWQSNSHIHTWPLEKPLTRWTFVDQVMSLLLNMLSRLVITCLPRMAAITTCSDFGAQKNKVSYCFYCFPIYLQKYCLIKLSSLCLIHTLHT